MQSVGVVAALLWLVAIASPSLAEDGRGLLEVVRLNEDEAEMTYTDQASGAGLRVLSRQGELIMEALDGRSLVVAEALAEDADVHGCLRLVTVGRSQFIQAKMVGGRSTDFTVPEAYLGVLSNTDQAVLRDLVSVLNATSAASEHEAKLWAALDQLLAYPETRLLPDAVAALGERGVTGRDFPSILPFFMAALRLDQLQQRSNITSFYSQPQPQPSVPWRTRDVREDCLSECPPCPYQECLGLCGYGCSCWRWVCGDCCYHLGCYEHDICCREKFVRTSCLFPFSFRCESEYNCD